MRDIFHAYIPTFGTRFEARFRRWKSFGKYSLGSANGSFFLCSIRKVFDWRTQAEGNLIRERDKNAEYIRV